MIQRIGAGAWELALPTGSGSSRMIAESVSGAVSFEKARRPVASS